MAEMNGVWLLSAGLIGLIIVALGISINGRYLGILIDSRAKMSLSRLQLVLWTWLFISALITVALTKKTLDIEISSNLLALMGLSVGSTAGSTIIKGVKAAKRPKNPLIDQVSCEGVLKTNGSAKYASLLDIFKGEETQDYQYIDVAKVQMFFFSLMALLAYIVILYRHEFIISETQPCAFPTISEGVLTLIGISHVGYLTVKSAPKTPTET